MTSDMIIEAVGYLGSALVVISMLMTSVKKLRIVNSIGSVIFAGYALVIHSYPTALMNFFLVGINVYNLVKLIKASKCYNVIECYKDESIVQLYLSSNLDDIKKFFPNFELGGGHLLAFLVCTGSTPVGIMIGKMENDSRIRIQLDYTIPAYRDFSVGSFLFNYLGEKWQIKEVVFYETTNNHEDYLLKMGFEKKDNGYIKTIE